MPPAVNNLRHALNPIRYPREATLAPISVLYHRLYGGGGSLGFLYTSPWGTYDTLRWLLHPPKPGAPGSSGGLEVSQQATDVAGFAIYGLVRVGGTSVIPPEQA